MGTSNASASILPRYMVKTIDPLAGGGSATTQQLFLIAGCCAIA